MVPLASLLHLQALKQVWSNNVCYRCRNLTYLGNKENQEVSFLDVILGEGLSVVFKLLTVSDELLLVSGS